MRRLRPSTRSGRLRAGVPTLAVVSALLLQGCALVGADGNETEVVIGLDMPLTGKFTIPATAVRNSAEMAIAKANSKHLVKGIHFTLDVKDDSGEPQVAKNNATDFVNRKELVGVVGPYNSAVALEMTPVLAKAGIAQISPANTLPALTWGQNYQTDGKKRQYPTYFRTVTTDAVQGPYVARYAIRRMHLGKVAVIDDTKAYGVGLADQFAGQFKADGGQVVMRTAVQPGTTDFTSTVAQIKAARADLVFFGGESTEAGPLSAQLKAAGVKIPVAGGDGVHKTDYPKLAGGDLADGDLASSDGVAIDNLASAYAYLDAYQAGGYQDPPGVFGPYAYDSVWALMLAVGQVMDDHHGKLPASGVRELVAGAVQGTNFFGVTGDVSFDEFGDSRNQIVSLYQIKAGQWETVVGSGKLTTLS